MHRAFRLNDAAPVAGNGVPPSLRVGGPYKIVAAAALRIHAARIAFRAYRNPFRAARAYRRLRATLQQRTASVPGRKRLWASQKCFHLSGRYFWDLYVPGWPSEAFDRCLMQELDRVDPLGRPAALQTAIIAMTRRCALGCEHCFESDVLNRPEALSAMDLQEIVRRLQRLGVTQIFFSGGEPLQRFDHLVALAAAASGSADVWIVTSGRGLTPERAGHLREAGVTGVVVSLDHWDPLSHDRFRGLAGSFVAAGAAARNAREAGLLVALSLCATRAFVTAGNLRRYAELARTLGAIFIQILEPRALGRYASRDVLLRPGQLRLLERFCDRLNHEGSALDLPSVSYFDWNARAFGCSGAGDRFVYVDTEGCLQACPYCRVQGVSLLDHDIHSALSFLKSAGCPAGLEDHSCGRI